MSYIESYYRLAEESPSLETSHACLELQSLKSAIELLESDIKQLEKMIGNLGMFYYSFLSVIQYGFY